MIGVREKLKILMRKHASRTLFNFSIFSVSRIFTGSLHACSYSSPGQRANYCSSATEAPTEVPVAAEAPTEALLLNEAPRLKVVSFLKLFLLI
jgi:hypothetical protein